MSPRLGLVLRLIPLGAAVVGLAFGVSGYRMGKDCVARAKALERAAQESDGWSCKQDGAVYNCRYRGRYRGAVPPDGVLRIPLPSYLLEEPQLAEPPPPPSQ